MRDSQYSHGEAPLAIELGNHIEHTVFAFGLQDANHMFMGGSIPIANIYI